MNDWQKIIVEGMLKIKEGCHENTEWENCWDCPFCDYCGTEYGITPANWEINIEVINSI